MKKKIQISDFIELQQAQEDHDIPFAASISRVMSDLINFYVNRDFDEIYIELNDLIVPDSFKNNSCIWAKQLKPSITLPHIKTFKRPGVVSIIAGRKEAFPNWLKQLRHNLTQKSIIIYPMVNVPKAYRANPYLVVNRLRKEGIEISVSPQSTQLTIIKKHT